MDDEEVVEVEDCGEEGLIEGVVDGIEEVDVGRRSDLSSAESQVSEALERL